MKTIAKTTAFLATAGLLSIGGAGASAQTTPGMTAQGGATGSATAPAAAPMAGQAAATAGSGGLAAGATVYDTQNGTVGKVESIDGDYAVIATAQNKVRLPKSSFANGPNGPVIAMTAAQLDQEAAKAGAGSGGTAAGAGAAGAAASSGAAATAKPTVAAGAAVSDTSGGSVGKIAEVKGELATIELASGSKVQVPANALGAGANGGLVIAMSAAQLDAAASASGAAASAKGGKAKSGN